MNENALIFSQKVFEALIEIEKSPTQEAINLIKEELGQLY
jgi:hypothetical protein